MLRVCMRSFKDKKNNHDPMSALRPPGRLRRLLDRHRFYWPHCRAPLPGPPPWTRIRPQPGSVPGTVPLPAFPAGGAGPGPGPAGRRSLRVSAGLVPVKLGAAAPRPGAGVAVECLVTHWQAQKTCQPASGSPAGGAAAGGAS